ncbi:MAG: hypothetical protein WD060_11305 [Pirellulales bacterium]
MDEHDRNLARLVGLQKFEPRPGANGVIELALFEFLDRLADAGKTPLRREKVCGPGTAWCGQGDGSTRLTSRSSAR